MKPIRLRTGLTLVELTVATAVLGLLMLLVGIIGKFSAQHRIRSETKLKLQEKLQKVTFFIENDFYSARRHTLGNVLCNNIIFTRNGNNYRTTSDPGFDTGYTRVSSSNLFNDRWVCPTQLGLVPVGLGLPTGQVRAYVDTSSRGRFHGVGSMAIDCSLPVNNEVVVRSPLFNQLRNVDYILSGWVRSDMENGSALVASLALQTALNNGNPAADIVSVSDALVSPQFGNWRYLCALIPANLINGVTNYNVYLRATVATSDPTTMLTAYFDDISVTPATDIAMIDFALQAPPPALPVNLNNRFNLGLTFYQTEPMTGALQEIKYLYCNGNQFTYPSPLAQLSRLVMTVPYFDPTGIFWPGFNNPTVPDPPLFNQPPLNDVTSLSVSWVGNWTQGVNRPIRISLTVVDGPPDRIRSLNIVRELWVPTP